MAFQWLARQTYTMEPLLSPDWYRVAEVRPRLRSGVVVSTQQVRQETWHLLSDPMSGRHHRINDLAFRLLSACDGERTLGEVWEGLAAKDGDLAPTQGQAIRFIAQGFSANLLVGNVAPDAAALIKSQRRIQRQRARAGLNPLAFKVPLWNPDAFLNAHIGRWRWVFTPMAARIILLIIGLGALLLAVNASDYTSYARSHLSSARLLLILWLAYPLVKALHEMAHAFAVKSFGGEVHEIGVTLLMLTPVPYVDASASMGFSDKHQRVAVASAGIAVELVLGTVALCLWLALENGLTRDIAFAVVLIGGVSTLAVNGNPLLRFDGYHMLCDQFELPSLARRSELLWLHLLKRFILGVEGSRFDGHARGALPWLLAYAPLAWLYRVVLLALLSIWLAERSSLLGLAGLALALWLCLVQPTFQSLRYVLSSPELHGQRTRAALVSLVGVTALSALMFGASLPNQTRAPGVVWLPDEAMVRLGTDGFVEELLAADGDEVIKGQPLMRLANDELEVELQRVRAALTRLEVERAGSFGVDPLRAGVADDERTRLLGELAKLEQRASQLLVRAGVAGRLVIEQRLSRMGQYLTQGELVAQVLSTGAPLVRALVRNEDVSLMRDDTQSISVALAYAPGLEATGRLVGAVPRATTSLPSAALGETAGGSIAVDGNDKTGRTAQEPRFQVDLRLEANPDARVGARALVTFRHSDASAATMLANFARRSFLRFFER